MNDEQEQCHATLLKFLTHSPEDILLLRRFLHDLIKTKLGSGLEHYTSDAALQWIVDLYDYVLFNNAIKRRAKESGLYLAHRYRFTEVEVENESDDAGYTYVDMETRSAGIVMNEHAFKEWVKADGNKRLFRTKCVHRTDCFIAVIEHELAHLLQMLYCEYAVTNPGHDKVFSAIVKQYFKQGSNTHALW